MVRTIKYLNVTKEFNIGPHSMFYRKFQPILDYFPAEIAEMIFSYLPEKDLNCSSTDPEEEEKEPEYDFDSEYESDFELYGNILDTDEDPREYSRYDEHNYKKLLRKY